MDEKSIEQVGRFRCGPDGRWSWSDAMFALHGLDPGSVEPSRGRLLDHARPEERARLAVMLTDAGPTACEYTLLAATGRERRVILVTEQAQDQGIDGFLIDMGAHRSTPVAERVTTEVLRAQDSRAVIEQAKGVLMLAHGVESDRAFELLAWCSQHNNVKLAVLADRFVGQVQIGAVPRAELRLRVDDLLLDCSRSAPPAVLDPGRSRSRTVRIVQDDATAVRLEGSGDLESAYELSRLCASLLATARSGDVVTIDLRGASEISTAVLSVLHSVRRRCEAIGVVLALVTDPRAPAVATRVDAFRHLRDAAGAAVRDPVPGP